MAFDVFQTKFLFILEYTQYNIFNSIHKEEKILLGFYRVIRIVDNL